MDTKIFLATTGHGIARAEARAAGSWSVEHLLPEYDVRSLAAAPLRPTITYAGTQGRGVLRSDDRGRTWRPAGLDGKIIKSIAVSRVEPDTVYAGTKPARLYVSRDGGLMWRELESFRRIRSRWFWFSPAEKPFTAYVQAIALSPTDPSVVLAGIEAGAVMRSIDGGHTWSGHRPGALRDCHSLIFHATNGNWVYQGGAWFRARGAAVSRDAGAHWTAPRDGIDRAYGWAVAADPARPEVWYISVSPDPKKAHSDGNAQACIFRSIGGARWEKLSGGLPQPLDYMPYALLTDPQAQGHVYAGLSNGEVWQSSDYGEAWQRLPFTSGAIQQMLILV